ncbi:hypothetical protein N7532_008467 [Penicillium argentinense]|uniref:DUF7514 domain-containing protein n=1 Tax=Penicillium argentinense TaxID=1131581 RepID=A0A9W9EXD9_9EURO|nr:uncharacterized protein N7532_008467 [Penicillium argentinense]KAJ5089783.1 hypothetical protein N7532_008467 [Penicillium argentinense]
MAYNPDGYRSTPNPYQMGHISPDSKDPYGPPQPPYPSYHETEHLNMPQPQMPPHPSSTSSMDGYAESPRAESTNPGHINDAVNSAVRNANTSAYLSPDVLSQITATVIQQLKATGLDSSNLQGSGPPPVRSQSQQPPYAAADGGARPHSESPPIASQRSGSVPVEKPMSQSFDTNPYVPRAAYAGEPRTNPKPSPDSYSTSRRRESMSSQGSQHTRPKPPDRDTTVMEMTTLERIWGKLFEDGEPTKRLGQFLRGIAMHLIEDYPPGNTLVITTAKLEKFYKDTHVPGDPYPWHLIWDDRTSSVSRLFRDLKISHHLVQEDDLGERPDVPGLTPKGFEKWATILILANPNREYERLQKALVNMPISNPDDKRERFPKEIPRRLFPETPDIGLREEAEQYIMERCGVDLPHITDEEREEARPKTASRSPEPAVDSSGRARSYERGRPPPAAAAAAAASSSAVIDDDDPTPFVSIERERKPYSAQPGGGKKYEDLPHHSRSSASSFSTARPSDLPRASDISGTKPVPPYDYDSRYGRAGPGHGHGHGPSSRRYSRRSRSSSRGMNPPRAGDYRHSEGDLLNRDNVPRYEGVSAADLYTESPTSIFPDTDDIRHGHRDHRDSARGPRPDEYHRGMLGGHGGGPVHEYKKYY